ncbi:hypothetical protein Lfu02_01050 [Longispora fulva]|nr:hypothetical protein Lfu02_01050 [Longispora fulva]
MIGPATVATGALVANKHSLSTDCHRPGVRLSDTPDRPVRWGGTSPVSARTAGGWKKGLDMATTASARSRRHPEPAAGREGVAAGGRPWMAGGAEGSPGYAPVTGGCRVLCAGGELWSR